MQTLPSGQQPAAPSGHPVPGLVLAPFRGLRYAQDRVSGLAEVTSPPYDVIAQDAAAQLRAADPHNVVRLILPRHDGSEPGDAYADAARLLRDWQHEGILVPDRRPALYLYEQSQPDPYQPDPYAPATLLARGGDPPEPLGRVLQRGFIGALHLVPLGDGSVLPHEDVLPEPVAGRRQLMEATCANLEPIFLLYDGDEDGPATTVTATTVAGQVATRQPPLLSVDTDDGIRHRLWAVTDPAHHAAIAADLATRQALIADGHHRYAAYLDLQARKRASGAGPGPWDAGLALLVDSAAFPPTIGAIHRVIAGLPASEAVRRARSAFSVSPLPATVATEPAAALAVLVQASRDGTAFVLVGDGEAHLLTRPDPARARAAMPGRSARWRALPASVLQELLLAQLWGIADDERGVQVHHDAAHALAAARQPRHLAVICPPLSTTDVHEVAAHGERVPRKSTSFAPKPRSGLVIRSFGFV